MRRFGFDVTAKPTKVNELDEIGKALAKFINVVAEDETGLMKIARNALIKPDGDQHPDSAALELARWKV